MSGRKRSADFADEEESVEISVADGPDDDGEVDEGDGSSNGDDDGEDFGNEEDEDECIVMYDSYDSNPGAEYRFIIRHEESYDYPNYIGNYTGQVLFGEVEIGSLDSYFVQRNLSTQFYAWCDSIDAEVQECSTLFFDKKGGIDKKYRTKFSSAAQSEEAYVHITRISIDDAHRGKDLGIRLLKALLDQFGGIWAIAMMQPYPMDAGGAAFRLGIEKLTRYFARLGFKQVGTNPSSSEIKFSALQLADYTGVILDKAAVLTLPVVLPVPEVVLSDATKEIKKLIETTEIPDARDQNALALNMLLGRPAFNPDAFAAQVRAIQARGGDVNAARALHFAVANEKYPLISPLIQCGKSLFWTAVFSHVLCRHAA
jgi:GNAT superfamily N-acetyltransferase